MRHRVRVLSPYDAPVEDALVEVAAWSAREPQESTTTDREGLAVLDFEDEGVAYWIRVDHPNYPSHDAFLERSDSETTITLEEGRPVPVEVIHDTTREPIANLAFLIRTDAESARPLRRVTDADGSFVVTLPLDRKLTRGGARAASRIDYSASEGQLELPFACEPELSDWQARIARAYDPDTARAALLECFSATGFDVTVLRADGRPAAGATIRITLALADEQFAALLELPAEAFFSTSDLSAFSRLRAALATPAETTTGAEIVTDAQGYASVRRIPPDLDYVISATDASHHFGASDPQTASLGQVRDVSIRLDRDSTGLRVHVAAESEASAQGYHISIMTPDGLPALASRTDRGPTISSVMTVSGEGAFFPVLRPGRYLVGVSRSAMQRTETVDVIADAVTEKTIRIDGGLALEGRVVDPEGKPAAGISVTFETNDGGFRQPGAGTGPEGRFVIRGLPPAEGRLTLDNSVVHVLTTPHGEQIMRPSNAEAIYARLVVEDVVPGGPPLEIRLRRAGRVEARLSLADAPPPDAASLERITIRLIDPDRPLERNWSHPAKVGPDRHFSAPIPILDRPVLVRFSGTRTQWSVPGTIVFRSGETTDFGELRPD